MPNPASVYCEQNGNKLEIRTAADGSQSGVCVFPDGSTCDEWAYFRGECGPSMKSTREPAATVDPTQANASGGYMPPGTSEPFTTGGGSSRAQNPAHSMMIILSGRTWVDQLLWYRFIGPRGSSADPSPPRQR